MHDLQVEPSDVGSQGQKKQKNNRDKLQNKIKFVSMKNTNLLPNQTMFKCIHDIFDELDGKVIELDTIVQEKAGGLNKEIYEAMLKLC